MDQDFLDVTENSKKTGFIFVLFVIIIGVLGYFVVFKQVYFSVKNVKLELGEELSENINDYLSKKVIDTSDYKIDISKVKPDEIGEYSYSITYNKIVKKGKVKVVDTVAPTFTLKEMIIEKGSTDYFLGDFLETCEDASKPCLVTLKNEKDEEKFGIIGTHSIEIEIKDLYGNKTSASANLKVVEEGAYVDERTLDLEYNSNSKNIENFTGLIYLKLEKAIPPNGDQAGASLSEVSTVDLEEYVHRNYEGYDLVGSEIIELYNKSSYIIGYSIELKISNGKEKTIYVDKSKIPNNTSSKEEQEE